MGGKGSCPRGQLTGFLVFLLVCLLFQGLYVLNMVQWVSSPEVGFRVSPDLDPHTVFSTTKPGSQAGLSAGDWIHSINGKTFQTHAQRRELITRDIGSVNYYEVEREGKRRIIPVVVAMKGKRIVLTRSGLPWLIGLLFTGIGVVVFLMKPFHRTSWSFIGMTTLMGITIPYINPSALYRPQWLEGVGILSLTILPATVIDLAAVFPRQITTLARNPWFRWIPYLLSFVLAALSFFALWGKTYANVGKHLRSAQFVYAAAALAIFFGLNLYSSMRAGNRAVRYQALLVITGFTFALLIPLAIGATMLTLNVVIVPARYFLPVMSLLFLLFPLSLGYAIVRHDLFAIDVIIRRTYGYFLSTGTIIAIYTVLVSGLNTAFQTAEVSRSPLFSILFALTVVFTFRPLHERFQGLVDRFFYRQQYDYRRTIKGISETMVSLFDPGQIRSTLIGTVVEEMFLENGVVFQKGGEKGSFMNVFSIAEDPEKLELSPIEGDHPLVSIMTEKDAPVYFHEIDLDPEMEEVAEPVRESFRRLDSEIMLPLRYKEDLLGIVSLGRKKSGKMFSSEDDDLLRTVVNQGAVALENARLFEENLEKGRMEEELKIAHDLQLSMFPEKAPLLEGIQIAARSTPAQEVGGDFYDFIDMSPDGSGGKVGIVVADVSGKAVSGALVMSAARSIFRVLSEGDIPVREVMTIANTRLKRDVKKGMFTALLYAVIDPKTRTLTLSNAGQTQPLLLAEGAETTVFLGTEGDRFPLGIVEPCLYEDATFDLKSGDCVVLYTDGLVEAVNGDGEMYGFERFEKAVAKSRGLDAESLLERLNAEVLDFVGNEDQHDDITIVIIKVD